MIKRIFFPILLLVLFGCSDKDDDVVVTEQSLEINSTNISGKWNHKGDKLNGGPYGEYSHSCSTSKDNMDLQPSNILVYNNFGNCQITTSYNTTWNLTGDKLELGGRLGSITPIVYFYVVKLTNNELVLNEVAGSDSPNNQNGYGGLHYYTRN